MAKLRVIATGEILDFAPTTYVLVHRPGTNEQWYMKLSDVEIIDNVPDDKRNLFAMAALQALMIRGDNSDEWLARRSFEIADEMVKQMKSK